MACTCATAQAEDTWKPASGFSWDLPFPFDNLICIFPTVINHNQEYSFSESHESFWPITQPEGGLGDLTSLAKPNSGMSGSLEEVILGCWIN